MGDSVLLDQFRAFLDDPEGSDAWHPTVRNWLWRKVRAIFRHRRGPVDLENVVDDLITEKLLAESAAGIREIVRVCENDRMVRKWLHTTLQRYIRGDRRSIVDNKRRAVRRLLQSRYEEVPGPPTGFRPPGRTWPRFDGARFQRELPRWVEDWVRREGRPRPVLGRRDSTQLPVIVAGTDLEHLVAQFFQHCHSTLTSSQVFAWVYEVCDLRHWEEVFGLFLDVVNDVPDPPPPRPGGEHPQVGRELESDARQCLRELPELWRAFLAFHLGMSRRGDGVGVTDWLRGRGVSKSSFYAREYPAIRECLVGWHARHPHLPLLVLDILSWERIGLDWPPDFPSSPR